MDKLGRFCVLFATNAHKHSSYDIGAKSKFFAIRIQKLTFGTNMVVISEEDEPPETKKVKKSLLEQKIVKVSYLF